MAYGIPRTDPFSYAFPDRPWIEMRWLFTVLVYGLFRVGGVNLLILGKGVVLLGAFGLLGLLRPHSLSWPAFSILMVCRVFSSLCNCSVRSDKDTPSLP